MLLREQGGWHQDRDLLARLHGNKGRTHGDFSFTKAHIAANQAIHGALRAHIGQGAENGGGLVGSFFKQKAIGEAAIFNFVEGATEALAGSAASVKVE